MRYLRPKIALCGLLAVGMLAACSSSGSDGSGAESISAQNGSSSAAGGNTDKSPIKVMVTGTLSSPNLSYPQYADAANAAADAINKAGGINGHPMKVIACNDGLDPNKAMACVQKATQEKVVALISGINLFTAQLWPKLEAAGIPWVGVPGISEDQVTNKLSYPTTAAVPGTFAEAGRLAVEHGGKRIVIFKHENPQAAFVASYIKKGVELAGGTVVKTVTSKIGSPDTSSAAAQAMDANPDGIGCACNQGDTARLLKSVRQAGFTGSFTASTSSFTEQALKSLGSMSKNVYFASDTRGADDAEAKQWVSEMKAYKPSARLDNGSAIAWTSTHVVADLLKGQSEYTAASLIKALDSARDINLYKMAGDSLTFTGTPLLDAAPRVRNMNVLDMDFQDGKFTELTGKFVDALRGS